MAHLAGINTEGAVPGRKLSGTPLEAVMAQTGRERTRDGGVYGSAVAAAGWQRGSAGRADLRPITDRMLDLAGIRPGHRVLDVAAGTGEQTLMAARRVGPDGFVLATDIADRMLAYLDEAARNEGLTNVQTRLVDARLLELERDSFDAAICRLVPTRKGMQTRPASS